MTAPAERRAAAAGFTLIEVLVALAIAALGLGALLAAASTGLGNAALADRYLEAVGRAQSRLAAVGITIPLQPGTQSGDDGEGFTWRVSISQPVAHANAAETQPAPPASYGVEVSISWRSGALTKSLSLVTERLGPLHGS